MSTSIHILSMHPDHIPAIAKLERECFSRPWSERMLAEELENQCTPLYPRATTWGRPYKFYRDPSVML